MKFSCTKENLAQALSLTTGLTNKNINLPILNNILIRADDQKVTITATNLELATVVVVRAKVESPGAFTVPARTLTEFINLLTNDKVDITLQENELVVSSAKTTTKIKGSPADDFPVVPTPGEGAGYLVSAQELRVSLSEVLPAVAKNEIRPELAGVLFSFNNDGAGLVLAATDSYRLAEKKMSLAQGQEKVRVVVPGRTAQELAHALNLAVEEKTVRLLVSESQLAVHYGPIQIISRLVDGNYPDYTQIIPKEFKTTVGISVADFSKELKTAGLFTTNGVNAVNLVITPTTGSVSIAAASSQTGDYHSELNAEVSGEANTIVLNHRYVLDGLNNMSTGRALVKIINGDSPCVISPEGEQGYLYIVMPIRQ